MAATDMSPKAGKPLVENDAGSYLAWSGKDQPAVAGEKLGCGLLVLKPLGFALPHYADSGKFGYVLGGSAVVGVLPAGVDARERVVRLEAGDVIAMRAGEVTCPGDISYFVLAGPMGVLGGLDAGLLAKASGLTSPEQAATAFRSQPAALLTRLNGKLHGVRPREHDRHGLVVNAARVPADSNTGGAAAGTKTVTAAHLPVLAQLGFSVGLTRLDAGAAVRGPWVLRDAAAQAVYVARGSGRVQVAGAGGASTLLDAEVAAGSLLVVPRYGVSLAAADDAGGMELVSLIKSPRPATEHFTGKGSVIGGLTAEIVQAALNVSPEFAGKPLVENDAGSYLAWSGKNQPALAGEKLGCGLLVLKPLGFALPHYADSGKFGYVLGGSAVVGVLPVGLDARERVVRLEAGDVIAMRAGEVTWWYNDADGEDVTIVFMGDTARAASPGDISYFVLAGPMGVLGGLDAGLLATALLVVPRYALALVGVDAGGMELVSLIKSPRPAMEQFTGKGSVIGGLTAEIVQAALNVSPELVEQLRMTK
uniref:Cupin type-1 domain-containing protein n=1 Tax=Oryza barthii TaxID=65489 RepID=A0A0D3H9T3_9ORYZ